MIFLGRRINLIIFIKKYKNIKNEIKRFFEIIFNIKKINI